MSFATFAIAALLSTAAAQPTTASSEQQPRSTESHSSTATESAPKEQRAGCCDHMSNCMMHETHGSRTVEGGSSTISHSGP